METIKKKYIINERQEKVAVQIDIADCERLEQVIEVHALGALISANKAEDVLSLEYAQSYLKQLR
jgi:hypothetical protein